MRLGLCALAGYALSASAGCYRITITSGEPLASAPLALHTAAWHHDFVYGLAEGSGPIDLQAACSRGWGRIHTEQTFVNGLVGTLTWGIYTPQSETLTCTAPEIPVPLLTAPRAER